jgi:hypothetical protein
LDFILNIALEAVHGSQHTNDTKYADGNAEQRQRRAEFVFPQLLHGHFKTADNNFDTAAHGKSLIQS